MHAPDGGCRWSLRFLRRIALAAALAAPLAGSGAGCTGNPQGAGSGPAADADAAGTPPEDPAAIATLSSLALDAGEFELTDQDGTSCGTDDLRGQVWIANFIFTRCRATCPQQTSWLAELQRSTRNWPEWERMRFVSFTVDPAHDTPDVLRAYAAGHGADPEHWKFLTGPREALWRISRENFKLPVRESAADPDMPIAHSSRFILIDAQLRIRGYFDSLLAEDRDRLISETRRILSEPFPGFDGPFHVGVPGEVLYAPWVAPRRAAQLATAPEIGVDHDFRFTDQREASGITFLSRGVADCGRDWKLNHYDHANGLAAADVDGDGRLDIYFLSQVGGNELWRNLGEGRFENMTDAAGVALRGRVCVSASFADVDNDGDPDLYVTTTRFGNVLFENDGQGKFRDVTAAAGLEHTGHSSSAEFFDYDRDGLLDLFVTNVGQFTTERQGSSLDAAREEHPYFIGTDDAFALHLFPEKLEQSLLYHNEGNLRFRDVSEETGLVHRAWSGDATPWDANDDGWPDLYVLNMQGNDHYYENVEGRQFVRRSRELFPASPWGAMGVKSFDWNNDGLLDLYVTNMHADMWADQPADGSHDKQKVVGTIMPETYLKSRNPGHNVLGNAFFERRAPGLFEEISDRNQSEIFWPWGLSVGDLNADGWQDVFVTACMNLNFRYHPNSLLLNDRGRTFRDAEYILGVEPRAGGRTAAPWFTLDCSGADARHKRCADLSGNVVVWGAIGSRSSVILDLDDDGDLDIVTNDFHTAPMVLVSDLAERRPDLRFLKMRLRGTRSNRDGLGARVTVTLGDRVLTQVHDGQSGYLSQSSLPLYFGLGDAQVVDRIVVRWPSGHEQSLAGPIEVNRLLTITEDPSSPAPTRSDKRRTD